MYILYEADSNKEAAVVFGLMTEETPDLWAQVSNKQSIDLMTDMIKSQHGSIIDVHDFDFTGLDIMEFRALVFAMYVLSNGRYAKTLCLIEKADLYIGRHMRVVRVAITNEITKRMKHAEVVNFKIGIRNIHGKNSIHTIPTTNWQAAMESEEATSENFSDDVIIATILLMYTQQKILKGESLGVLEPLAKALSKSLAVIKPEAIAIDNKVEGFKKGRVRIPKRERVCYDWAKKDIVGNWTKSVRLRKEEARDRQLAATVVTEINKFFDAMVDTNALTRTLDQVIENARK